MDSPNISARPDIAVATTTPRVTPRPAQAEFKEVLSRSLVRGAEAAMRTLPGAPLMAVAVRGAAPGALGIPMTGVAARTPALSSPEGPGGRSAATSLGGGAANATALGAANAPAEGGGGLEASLAQSQEMNLYYLQVQEQVNAQSRSFTALSNVLKAEHETVKTAIGNIR